MAIAQQPPVLSIAWASNSSADKNDIPVTMAVADMSNDGAASWSMGFPSQTSLSQGQGGYYVARQDMNGALYTLSQFALYAQSGAVYTWSASVDYAIGAHVRGSDGVEYIAVANSGPDVSRAVNPTTDVNYTTWKPYLRSIADFIYPVGSIYMSVNATPPAILFGGTWVQIAGRVLVGNGGGFTAGQTGGNAGGTHKITVNELPAHNHTATTADAGGHIHTATNANAGAHTHSISITKGAQSAGAHTHGVTYAATTVNATAASAGAHTHSVSFPKTTIASTSAGNHTHARGTLNITGTFDADDLNNDNTTPTATGAFGYKKSTTRRDAENGSHNGYAITFNAKNGWEGSLKENGEHTHSVTIAKTTMTTGSAGAHTHSVSVAIPQKDMTTESAGAHTHNLSGTTASAGSHTHTITVQTSGVHQHNVTVNNTGGSVAMNIMPPYLVVYMWQRTA